MKRGSQQVKRAKTSKQELTSPSPPQKGFRMLPTGEYSSGDEEDYKEKNVRARVINLSNFFLIFLWGVLNLSNFFLNFF